MLRDLTIPQSIYNMSHNTQGVERQISKHNGGFLNAVEECSCFGIVTHKISLNFFFFQKFRIRNEQYNIP